MISFSDVTVKYNKEVALQNVSFEIKKGEFVFLTGVSGSGKTTLIKLLYGEMLPSEGQLTIFGRTVNKLRIKHLRRRIGVVFQNYELLPNKSVYDNVSYPLSCLGVNPFKVKRETMKALEMMNIAEYAKKKPQELSGGQQQRVAIARAIVNKPEILICDEPTGNLDSENTKIIMQHLLELNDAGTTVVMSTHSEEILREINRRTLRLEKGVLVQDTGSIFSLNDGVFEPLKAERSKPQTKEMEILKELGWTEDDEERYQKRVEGGQ